MGGKIGCRADVPVGLGPEPGENTMRAALPSRWLLGMPVALLTLLALTPGRAQAIGAGVAKALAVRPVVLELRATKQLLERADHDYKGHRARAVHEINAAIHSLDGHHPVHHLHPTGHT